MLPALMRWFGACFPVLMRNFGKCFEHLSEFLAGFPVLGRFFLQFFRLMSRTCGTVLGRSVYYLGHLIDEVGYPKNCDFDFFSKSTLFKAVVSKTFRNRPLFKHDFRKYFEIEPFQACVFENISKTTFLKR